MYQQIVLNLGERARNLFPGGRPDGRAFRKLIAALDTKYRMDIPSWFFGYQQDGQVASDHFPVISLGTTSNGSLCMKALGPQACELLVQKGWQIQAALMREAEEPIRAHDQSGEHTIDPVIGTPRRYFAHRIVIGKATPDSFWWRNAKAQDGSESGWSEQSMLHLSHVIGKAIYDQSAMLLRSGDSVGGEIGEWLESRLGTSNPATNHKLRYELKMRLGLKVVAIGGHTYIRSTGKSGLRVMLKDVEIEGRCDLGGPWLVGSNRIEGYGWLNKSSRGYGGSAFAQPSSHGAHA